MSIAIIGAGAFGTGAGGVGPKHFESGRRYSRQDSLHQHLQASPMIQWRLLDLGDSRIAAPLMRGQHLLPRLTDCFDVRSQVPQENRLGDDRLKAAALRCEGILYGAVDRCGLRARFRGLGGGLAA